MIEHAYQRLATYEQDLSRRLAGQQAWHAAHPEWPTCVDVWRTAPTPVQEQHANECPDTMDRVTAERFADLLLVALAAFRRSAAEHG